MYVKGLWSKPCIVENPGCLTYDCPVCFCERGLSKTDKICEQCQAIVCGDCLDEMNYEQRMTCSICRFRE
jgi:hypothetical protein